MVAEVARLWRLDSGRTKLWRVRPLRVDTDLTSEPFFSQIFRRFSGNPVPNLRTRPSDCTCSRRTLVSLLGCKSVGELEVNSRTESQGIRQRLSKFALSPDLGYPTLLATAVAASVDASSEIAQLGTRSEHPRPRPVIPTPSQ